MRLASFFLGEARFSAKRADDGVVGYIGPSDSASANSGRGLFHRLARNKTKGPL